MAINFPSTPTNEQTYTENGITYVYSSAKGVWNVVAPAITGNSLNNQILYNSSNTIAGSNGMVYIASSNTVAMNNVAVTLNVSALYFYGNGAFLTGVAGDLTPAFQQANTGRDHANAAFARANDSVQYNVAGTFTEKQTFNANTSAATVTLIPRSSSPTVTAEGDLWFDNVAGRLRFRLNSAAREVVQLDGLQTSTARKTFTSSNAACGSIAITPVASLPNNIVQGDFVVSRTDNLVYYYADTTWRSLSTNVQLQAAFTLANIAYAHANAAFASSNADYAFSNSAHSIANLAFTHANAAFFQANTADDHANLSFAQANTARIHANSGFSQANTARDHANAAFAKANTSSGGGAYFVGNNGEVGAAAGLQDIFRVHTNTLTQNVTIYSGNNALAAGPITVAENRSLTIQTGARVSIV